jgi:hypothetical protein
MMHQHLFLTSHHQDSWNLSSVFAPKFYVARTLEELFYIFLSTFLQKYMVRFFFCKIIHLLPWGTAAGTYPRAPRR